MHFDVPDPRYTGSADSRALLKLAVRLAVGFVILLSLIHLMNWGLDLDPWPFGVRPRQWSGLVGIVTGPLVHSDFAHLFANALPLATVGAAMLFLYPNSALRVLPSVYLGSGLFVWLFGRGAVHLGASGLVYGLVSYVFVAGLCVATAVRSPLRCWWCSCTGRSPGGCSRFNRACPGKRTCRRR